MTFIQVVRMLARRYVVSEEIENVQESAQDKVYVYEKPRVTFLGSGGNPFNATVDTYIWSVSTGDL
ncbi:hypothetical protein [Vibrio phage J14]|nr:hypothetical protein [Vibrio phage J14]